MPSYKNLPKERHKEDLHPLLYRPVDRLMIYLWKSRKVVAPFLIAGLLLLIGFGSLRAYVSHYNHKAASLLAEGNLEIVAEQYPKSEAAGVARMKLGYKALEAKDYDQAVRWYLAASEDRSQSAILRINAMQNLALVYVKKNDFDSSFKLLNQAGKDPANLDPDYTRLLTGKVLEEKGETEKAKEVYKSLSEGSGSVQKEAKESLTWLESPPKK
jgi:predicted negative regulator of RcsB-dependent stress response